MESVRAASDQDRHRLDELARELVRSVTAQRGGDLLVRPELDDPPGPGLGGQLGALLGRSDTLVLVGTLDGVVVAFAVATWREDRHGARRGHLGACFVEEGARGVGVGRLLLDRSVAWLTEQGCVGVDGPALPGDRGSKSFYEAAGFKARLLTMHRPLDAPP